MGPTSEGNMSKKFPKQLFVKIEMDKDIQWFLAGESMDEMLTMNVKDKLAVYKLVEVREVITGVVSHKRVR